MYVWTLLPLVKSILTDISHTIEYISITKSYATEVYLRTLDVELREQNSILLWIHLLEKGLERYFGF